MAGRGRGHLTFSVEMVGISKGENLPPSSVKPTPIYPPLDHRPLPLQVGEEAEYLLALKQEFRGAMQTLPFYIRPAAPKKDVERYSDKYQQTDASESGKEWKPDWRCFPKELRVQEKRPPREKVAPKLPKPPQVDKEIIERLKTLEQREKERSSDEEEGEKKKEEDEAEAEEEYDEEEFEDETDYVMSYFENGEDFGGDSDDNMDEAVY